MVLETIWFYLWGLLWAVFFMTDGFDFGIGTLFPFIGKEEAEKKAMINALGPFWDGNEVWLITAGGVTFAAFPKVYSVMFSTLYTPLMLILFALIVRGVSFEFRGQIDNPKWKKIWDVCIFIGSALPAVLFGVAFANIFQGIPFDNEGLYHGTLISLLNPYGLLGGALFLLLFITHGALWLAHKTQGELMARAISVANKTWNILLVTAVVFLIATWFYTPLYENYLTHPMLFIVIVITVLGLLATKIFLMGQTYLKAFIASALTICGATFFGIFGLYPNLYPSKLDPTFNLTAHNAASSPMTLKIMLTVVCIFIPIVICYQLWAYTLFKDKVGGEDVHGYFS